MVRLMRNFCVVAAGLFLAGACAAPPPASVTAPSHGEGGGAVAHHDNNPRPFEADRNAMADIDEALAAAAHSGKPVLLVLGANWCHDSRGLAAKFQEPDLAQIITDGYELVWVDVGRRDRNLDVAARFGVFDLLGTPTILIVSPAGELLNADSVHDWRTADSRPYREALEYFQRYARVTDAAA